MPIWKIKRTARKVNYEINPHKDSKNVTITPLCNEELDSEAD